MFGPHNSVSGHRHPSTPMGKPSICLVPSRLVPTTDLKTLQPSHTTKALGDAFKDLFDFASWAPRSSRIWRLQQYTPPAPEDKATGSDSPDDLSALSDRINQLRHSESSSIGSQRASADSTSLPTDIASTSDLSPGFDAASRSFSDADDDEVSAALGKRISQIATTSGSFSSLDEEDQRQPLTGEEIRTLLLKKYNKQYDLSFVRRDVPGMKTFVCLNVMWLHLEQRSFNMTAQQYMEKLENVAALVNALGQTDKVRAFLMAPAKSQKGLPRRPVVGTAISIRFDLEQSVIDEWFGSQGF